VPMIIANQNDRIFNRIKLVMKKKKTIYTTLAFAFTVKHYFGEWTSRKITTFNKSNSLLMAKLYSHVMVYKGNILGAKHLLQCNLQISMSVVSLWVGALSSNSCSNSMLLKR